MTFHLRAGDAILGGTSARIPADQREAFADAHALLARAAEEAAGVSERVEAARRDGWEAGRREALERAEAEVASRVADLAAALADEAARRRAEIAAAAFAGAQAIIGALDPEETGTRLALHALARLPADERIVIHCAPALAGRLAAAVSGREGVSVEPRDGFGPLRVELVTGAGRVVAGLDVQLAALAERWGAAA